MKHRCRTCKGTIRRPWVPPPSGEVAGICPLCGGAMYEGQTVEFLIERHWDRQERARFMRSRSHRGFHGLKMFWVVMLACAVGLAALIARVFFQ